MCQHDLGRAGVAVSAIQQPPERGPERERLKEALRNLRGSRRFGFPFDRKRDRQGFLRDEIRHGRRPVPEPGEVVVRERAVVAVVDAHHLVRPIDRHRPEEKGVRDGEDRNVRANAERERQERDNGEARATEDQAKRVVKVPPEVLEPAEGASVAMGVLLSLRTDHAASRRLGRRGRQTAASEILFGKSEMSADLTVELGLRPRRSDEREKALNELAKRSHGQED